MTDKILIKIENLEVNLPNTHIIVEKEEYLNMKKQASEGKYMSKIEKLKNETSSALKEATNIEVELRMCKEPGNMKSSHENSSEISQDLER